MNTSAANDAYGDYGRPRVVQFTECDKMSE
jgi:hypothetical protein